MSLYFDNFGGSGKPAWTVNTPPTSRPPVFQYGQAQPSQPQSQGTPYGAGDPRTGDPGLPPPTTGGPYPIFNNGQPKTGGPYPTTSGKRPTSGGSFDAYRRTGNEPFQGGNMGSNGSPMSHMQWQRAYGTLGPNQPPPPSSAPNPFGQQYGGTFTPGGGQGNLAYAQPDQRPQPFSQNFTFGGQQFGNANDAFAMRDAMVQSINNAKGAHAQNWGSGNIGPANLDMNGLMKQAGDMVQGGWANPFAQQPAGIMAGPQREAQLARDYAQYGINTQDPAFRQFSDQYAKQEMANRQGNEPVKGAYDTATIAGEFNRSRQGQAQPVQPPGQGTPYGSPGPGWKKEIEGPGWMSPDGQYWNGSGSPPAPPGWMYSGSGGEVHLAGRGKGGMPGPFNTGDYVPLGQPLPTQFGGGFPAPPVLYGPETNPSGPTRQSPAPPPRPAETYNQSYARQQAKTRAAVRGGHWDAKNWTWTQNYPSRPQPAVGKGQRKR